MAKSTGALGAPEFDRLMRSVAPFESSPGIAVAVSGGPDSLALALLLRRWCKRRRGQLTALTVDHGLRPDSAAEARQVGRWLRARGVRHRILRWDPEGATARRGGLQAAARAARYRLLGEWCRRNRVLHLAVAHQREDQAETFLLRLSRRSGLAGLAAMAPVTEREGVRILRPLLTVPRARLMATLRATEQPWIEDPTNRNPEHARVRLRSLMPGLAEEGVRPARLARTARQLGRLRGRIDDAIADLLAEAAAPDPAGYVIIDAAALRGAPAEIGRQALMQCLVNVGGRAYPPRSDRLERVYRSIRSQALRSPATLGGCRILPRNDDRLLICREVALAEPRRLVPPRGPVHWDHRFCLHIHATAGRRLPKLSVGALGQNGWAAVVAARPELRGCAIPAPVRPSLPALWRDDQVMAVAHLGFQASRLAWSVAAHPWPAVPLSSARFTVA
jgi:tRNA(Ile)-lysidine synthase